jgi:hypothetical protein
MGLRSFSREELIFSRDDAYMILKFFFQSTRLKPTQLNDDDRAFAQALLLEAADRSYELGYAQILMEKFLMASPRSLEGVRDLLKAFIGKAAKHWWKHAKQSDLRDAKLYMVVVNQLRRNFRSTWEIREVTGELMY